VARGSAREKFVLKEVRLGNEQCPGLVDPKFDRQSSRPLVRVAQIIQMSQKLSLKRVEGTQAIV